VKPIGNCNREAKKVFGRRSPRRLGGEAHENNRHPNKKPRLFRALKAIRVEIAKEAGEKIPAEENDRPPESKSKSMSIRLPKSYDAFTP
jgi:hypothetical protein